MHTFFLSWSFFVTNNLKLKRKQHLVNSFVIILFLDRRVKISVKDFEPLKIIGRGAFGEVRVCRDKRTREIVAIKKMKKNEMIFKN